MVFPWLREAGEIPETSICVPLVFNDYVPLVLYGDSTSPIALDSLELLSHLTVLILKNHYLQMLLDSQTAPKKDEPGSEETAEQIASKEAPDQDSGEDFLTQMSAAEAANRVDIEEPQVSDEQLEKTVEEASEEIQESEPLPEAEDTPEDEEIRAEVSEESEEVAKEEPEPEIPEPKVEEEPEGKTPEDVAEGQEAAPAQPEVEVEEEEEIGVPTDGSVIGEFPAPPFQTDRPALEIVPDPTEPEVVEEVSEESDRLHTEARRFARLLVSEIKLYNESQVDEGRQHSDLYQRLSRDIDRSREMYEKRAHASVRVAADHFHEELVRILAKGEEGLLGKDYPGPLVKNS
jgi:hypothetical protein